MISARAQIVTKRTYNREKDNGKMETWVETITRVIKHQKWLWERQLERRLNHMENAELRSLYTLLFERKCMVAGRTLWLGGTDLVKRRESACFNCSFLDIKTVHDIVDGFWLLLQGCGVGFKPIPGLLWGFNDAIPNVEIIRSVRTDKRGRSSNVEHIDNGVWYISIGDSAVSWAKALGKIMVGNYKVNSIVIDLRELRPAGIRLKGYGWISCGDTNFSKAIRAIINIRNTRAGRQLTTLNILDIMNHLGTVLSNRRSAQIGLCDSESSDVEDFSDAKPFEYYKHGLGHRGQSNNTIVYNKRPSLFEIRRHFRKMDNNGGGDPGIANGTSAYNRAPWFGGFNPCVEVLLADKGFCNLVTVDVAKYKNRFTDLIKDIGIIARANYRQTLVNLKDEILQSSWHENNIYLRLCGVSLTGLARRQDITAYEFKLMKNAAISAAYGMADELKERRPGNTTLIKPEGTISKIMDTTEGHSRPIGKYILNNINFNINDPIIEELAVAGYKVTPNPLDSASMLIAIPTPVFDDVKFTEVRGIEINDESAISQLQRYKTLMQYYCEQNVSCTISYLHDEIETICEWLHSNWDGDNFVAAAFLQQQDPLKNHGYAYLPQELVTKDEYFKYSNSLKEVNLEHVGGNYDIKDAPECSMGACPTK